ncbi:hypothetical protein M378DRAFT_14839 [Amanita muscaria Koide BX008]|uniref:Uncharacterized protein n=1 Tax=Amanita muscaria (strain Koide BX008) TaxID=946122 RepID=A0A0C2SZ25_AMAMK|nr:hypothetical protein M378DRAFT_14839 [Amanita muscaria Koide BX008]
MAKAAALASEESENAVIDKFFQESGPLAGIIGSGSSSKGIKGKARSRRKALGATAASSSRLRAPNPNNEGNAMPDGFPMSDEGFPPALSPLHGASPDNDGDVVPDENLTPCESFLLKSIPPLS